MIVYTLLFTGHPPLSLILIITGVSPEDGVNQKDSPLLLSVHVEPPFNEYATAVLGLGQEVSVIEQVTALVADDHIPSANTLQDKTG